MNTDELSVLYHVRVNTYKKRKTSPAYGTLSLLRRGLGWGQAGII